MIHFFNSRELLKKYLHLHILWTKMAGDLADWKFSDHLRKRNQF